MMPYHMKVTLIKQVKPLVHTYGTHVVKTVCVIDHIMASSCDSSVRVAYDKTRIVGPGKDSKPSADSFLRARLTALLKDPKKEAHVLKVSIGPQHRDMVSPYHPSKCQ